MRAEVIAIGDELTSGQRLDTNTRWLSEELTACGLEVAFHTTVGDQLDDNIAAFCLAIERADVVVCTGGLGPTADDLTRDAIAAATEVDLVRDDASLVHIEQLFASRGRSMPERNAVQADFPAGAIPIANAHGTAPGIDMSIARAGRGNCRLFALPGVPAELKPMWRDVVRPAIVALHPEPRMILHRRIKCFGVGESHLEAMLPDLIARQREPLVGITVSDATITLRITASGTDEAACRRAIEPTELEIRQTLGDLVFGEEADELENAAVRLLAEQDLSLAVCEWATGGLIAERLENAGLRLPAVVIADVSHAAQLLNCELSDGLEPHDPTLAVALAEAVRTRTGADVGLAVAAFPTDVDAPDARLGAAVAIAGKTRRVRLPCAAHPAIRRPRAAKQALNVLRLTLSGTAG